MHRLKTSLRMQVELFCADSGSDTTKDVYKEMSRRLQSGHAVGSMQHKKAVLDFYAMDVRSDNPLFSHMAGVALLILTCLAACDTCDADVLLTCRRCEHLQVSISASVLVEFISTPPTLSHLTSPVTSFNSRYSISKTMPLYSWQPSDCTQWWHIAAAWRVGQETPNWWKTSTVAKEGQCMYAPICASMGMHSRMQKMWCKLTHTTRATIHMHLAISAHLEECSGDLMDHHHADHVLEFSRRQIYFGRAWR